MPGCLAHLPDEHDGEDVWQRHGELQRAPVAQEVGEDRQQRAARRPDELVRHRHDGTLLGRKQLGRHDEARDVHALDKYK